MTLSVSGENFGTYGTDSFWLPSERVIALNISGVACASPARVLVQGLQQIQCDLPSSAVVGYKDVQLHVAGQTVVLLSNDSRSLLVVCAAGQYGHTGETCLSCPLGAACAGYQDGYGADIREAAGSNGSGVVWFGNTEVNLSCTSVFTFRLVLNILISNCRSMLEGCTHTRNRCRTSSMLTVVTPLDVHLVNRCLVAMFVWCLACQPRLV